VHYAVPERVQLAAAVAAVRANRGLDELDGWLPSHASAHLRSGPRWRGGSAAIRARSRAP
jgi:error-prone DNA polymerase